MIIPTLNIYESWKNSFRIIADYLVCPSVPLLFGKLNYNQEMFTKELFDFFQARLLGNPGNVTEYRKKQIKYCNLFLNIIGEYKRDTPFTTVSTDFFEMMKEYICENMPIGYEKSVKEVLKECRDLYVYTKTIRRDRNYINFEENRYTQGILDFIEEEIIDNPKEFFILGLEYLYTLSIYIYMVEYYIYYKSKRSKPTFIDRLNQNDSEDRNKTKESQTFNNETELPKCVEIYLKDNNGKCYTIPQAGEWSIGRFDEEHNCTQVDITIYDDEYISRKHAILRLQKNVLGYYELTIKDFPSTMNHTVIQTPRIIELNPNFFYQLLDGDIIKIGKTYFTIHIKQCI